MSLTQFNRGMMLCLLALCCVLLSAGVALADGEGQSSTASASMRKDVDMEVKLYLLVASNAAGEAAKPPAQLDAAVRQLRASLPFSNYRWAATFINRINNGMDGNIKGIAGPLLGTTPPSSSTPSFYDLQLSNVSLVAGATGQELIRLKIHFGARLPVMTGGGSNAPQQINYEGTGISTTVSIRENEPVVIGTMSLAPSNDTLVLVILIKKIL